MPVDYLPTTFGTLDETLHTEGHHVLCIVNASGAYLEEVQFEFTLYNLPHNCYLFLARQYANWMTVNASHHNSLVSSQTVITAEQRC